MTPRNKISNYIRLLVGTFDDGNEYVLTSEDGYAIRVYDTTWYPVAWTIRTKRTPTV